MVTSRDGGEGNAVFLFGGEFGGVFNNCNLGYGGNLPMSAQTKKRLVRPMGGPRRRGSYNLAR